MPGNLVPDGAALRLPDPRPRGRLQLLSGVLGGRDRAQRLASRGASRTSTPMSRISTWRRWMGDRVYDGTTWTPLTARKETINVAGGSPVEITVRSSKHGPALGPVTGHAATVSATARRAVGLPAQPRHPLPSPTLDAWPARCAGGGRQSSPYAVALRWTALDPGTHHRCALRGRRRGELGIVPDAAELFECRRRTWSTPMWTATSATSRRTVPVRGKGDGRWPAPGWDPATTGPGSSRSDELAVGGGPPATGSSPRTRPSSGRSTSTSPHHRLGLQLPPIGGSWRCFLRDRIAAGPIDAEVVRQMPVDNRRGFAPTLVPLLMPIRVGGPVPIPL